MANKKASTALIFSALALVGDYSSIPLNHAHAAPIERAAKQLKLSGMKRMLDDLNKGWQELDSVYAEVTRVTLESSNFDAEKFNRIASLLLATRGLETALRSAEPPADLREEHLDLRRAVAKTRSRLATLDSLFKQATQKPFYVNTGMDTDGLKALAEHSTRRLTEIA